MDDVSKRFRMDFKITVLSSNEAEHSLVMQLDPDPARYEWREREGEPILYDRLDDVYIAMTAVTSLLEQAEGSFISCQPGMIDDLDHYLESRRVVIKDMLRGSLELPTFMDPSEEFLRGLEVNKLAFVMLSIDLVGSTRLSQSLPSETFARLVSTLIYEVSELVPLFHGYVLKYTGDGLIAYFPEPSFITMCDAGLSCALAMRILLSDVLNPILSEMGFPSISIRVGLDAGEAIVIAVGSPRVKQHMDVLGEVINIATKIQSQAQPGEICIGETLERNLHVTWRELCEPIELSQTWPYADNDGSSYGVWRLKS